MERLQLPVSSAEVSIVYGLQGRTVRGCLWDLKRPAGMSRDEHWFALFVLLSRATTLDNMLIYRLSKREHFEGGPPPHLLQEMARLRKLEEATIKTLDGKLKSLGLHNLRADVTQILIQSAARSSVHTVASTRSLDASASMIPSPAKRVRFMQKALSPQSGSPLSAPRGALFGRPFFVSQCAAAGDMHCGMYALNHALGLGMFSPPMMRLACDEVLAERGDHRSEHMHDNGWYSEQVMVKALEINTLFRWHMTPLWVNTDLLSLPREFIPGAVVHLRERRHWVALQADVSRNIVWLLDSLSPVGPVQMQWPEYVAYVYEHPNSYALLHVTSLDA